MGTYTYDSQNRRTKKVAGTTTHYVYGLNGLLYGEYDNAGDLIREYVYLNDAPLAQVDAGAPEVLTYLHTDHLGTSRFATNSGGTQVWAWSGDAFGVGAPSGSATVNIRMPGQYVDAESGLFYNWNRYYNPAIGRYISSDPIGIGGGLNTFLYVAANPVNYIDPEGKFLLGVALPFLTSVSLPSVASIGAAAVGLADAFGMVATGTVVISNAVQSKERKAYKAMCNDPIPPTGDVCEDAKNKLRRQNKCLQMREDYGQKWYGDSNHDPHNEQIRRAIKNLEDFIRDNCEKGCDEQD